METATKKLPQSRIRTSTVIAPEERLSAEHKALQALTERVEIKGFRIGKAPADKVRERVGAERVLEETIRFLLPAVLKEALEKSGAKPMLRPSASVASTDPLTIELTFVERPAVSVKNPRSLRVEKKVIPEATNEDVDAFVHTVLMQDTSETTVDRAAAKGDFVRMSLSTTKKGKPVDELTIGNYGLLIGNEDLLPELEPHLTGMKKDERKTADVSFPKDHDIPSIRGEKLSVAITVKSVAEVMLPELTQEYLKSRLGNDMTPDAFRSDVKKMITDRKRSEERQRREEELYEKVRAATTVDLAPEVIDAEVEDMAADLRSRLEKQGMTMDDWLKSGGKEAATVVNEMKGIAESRIKLRFGMQELASKLDIEPDAAHLASAIASAKAAAKKDGRDRAKNETEPGGTIHEHIRFDLTMQALVEKMIGDGK